jgi:hypothetical protein
VLDRQERTQRSANWGELRNAMWQILDQYPPEGVQALKNLPIEQQIAWMERVRSMLDAQIKNPVLIEDRESLGHWRNAISTAKTGQRLLETIRDKPESVVSVKGTPTGPVVTRGKIDPDEMMTADASSILSDTLSVWGKLVLDSDEVSATGGRPAPRKAPKQ